MNKKACYITIELLKVNHLFHIWFAGTKLSSVSLENLREHYKIPLTGSAHRAMQDVTTLCYVLQKMTFELKLTVPQLLEKSFRATDLPATRSNK